MEKILTLDECLTMSYNQRMNTPVAPVIEISNEARKELSASQMILMRLLNQNYSKDLTVAFIKAIRDSCNRALREMGEE